MSTKKERKRKRCRRAGPAPGPAPSVTGPASSTGHTSESASAPADEHVHELPLVTSMPVSSFSRFPVVSRAPSPSPRQSSKSGEGKTGKPTGKDRLSVIAFDDDRSRPLTTCDDDDDDDNLINKFDNSSSMLNSKEVFQIGKKNNNASKYDNKLTTCSLFSGLSARNGGFGWTGHDLTMGLCGGADTMAKSGTSGWGPPSNNAAGATPNSGWGAPPPPNPTAAAAWGNPVEEPSGSNNQPPKQAQQQQSMPTSSTPAPAPPSSAPVTSTSTSWAAAAGKGLPATDTNTNGTSTASKQLERLNSVREALFSQDGWGGSFVKQDTSWDVDGNGNGGQARAAAATAAATNGAEVKETNVWNAVGRNDGTDLWKSNLTGQPAAPKPQPANPWGHTPQNPTDYKNWGEDDEGGAAGGGAPHGAQGGQNNDNGTFWRPDQPNQFNKPQHDGWKSNPVAPPNWPDSAPGGPAPGPIGSSNHRDIMNDTSPTSNNAGWGAAPPQQPMRGGPSQWGNAPPPNSGRWGGGGADLDSPTMGRRMDDHTGTSLWGGKAPVQNGPNPSGSKWQDMPNMPNNLNRGPPGPPGGPGMMGGPRGGPKEPWGQTAPRGGGGSGWGDEPVNKGSGWGGEDMKPSGWGGPQQNDVGGWGNSKPLQRMPSNMRTSPSGSWDDPAGLESSGWGSSKPDMSNKPSFPSKEGIWQSKQFRILCDMGYRKEDVETALRACSLRLEDSIEMLSHHRRMVPPPVHDGPYGNGMESHFPGGSGFPPQDLNPGMPMNMPGKMPNSLHMMQQQPRQQQPPTGQPPPASGSGQQPSAQQLRLLVQQIQMAVQAGHLNPQVLNQPLAPQTLVLLNQLLRQIKHLQTLQQQHALASRSNPANQTAILGISVNITKTRQHIQNLQNQISAQQANYLKQQPMSHQPNHQPPQPMQQQGHMGMDNNGGGLGSAPPSGSSAMQEMFQGLNLMEANSNGSRLAQWKKDFAKAPGSGTNKSSSNLLLDNGPWGRSSESNGSGWPEKNDSDFGIPEFEPGKPWKGPGLKNPDEDPNLTPGSVSTMPMSSLAKSSTENTSSSLGGLTSPTWSFGKSEMKSEVNSGSSNWPGSSTSGSSNLTQIGQDLWGGKSAASSANSRGPPGWSTPSSTANNGWSTAGNSSEGGSCWLLLKNLTPQTDGSTLKTLCMQHGPLQHFDLFLNHSIALVMYTSSREAAKAQKALNNCLLGNTTIHANPASDSEVNTILQQLGVNNNTNNSSGANSATTSTSTPTRGGTPQQQTKSSTSSEMWGDSSSSSVTTSSALFPGASSVWSAPDSSSQLHNFLPGDLLGENNL